ncbi:MAG: ankyrin repeat and box protein 2-like isoform [Gammaproteobacteria bacterium]|nr:ankyrin repeat and box protein 2-like isoform [Gammaproteobacteria bacterium]
MPGASKVLVKAARDRNLALVKVLLDAGADPDISTEDGVTALHVSCLVGELAIVQALLAAKANPNLVNYEGCTALHLACSIDRADIVRALLLAGADPNIQDPQGRAPLHEACTEGNAEIIKDLLKAGANPLLRAWELNFFNLLKKQILMFSPMKFYGNLKKNGLGLNEGLFYSCAMKMTKGAVFLKLESKADQGSLLLASRLHRRLKLNL